MRMHAGYGAAQGSGGTGNYSGVGAVARMCARRLGLVFEISHDNRIRLFGSEADSVV